ncbi:MAG: GNAT family N-acetyltransferase [Acholeplasmataceae bacterium]|nr:MAG: GNAT family N-acetyltransferase [Acholeplasmataceae bacterium]
MSYPIIKKPFDALTNQELYQIIDLRNKVFIMEQQILYLDTDYRDQPSVHYFMLDNGKMICYLRLIPPGHKFDEYAFSRVATDPDYRSRGLARTIIMAAMNDIKGQPVRISGQAYLRDYYESFGFKVVKGPYMEEDILHFEMIHENR